MDLGSSHAVTYTIKLVVVIITDITAHRTQSAKM